MGFRGDDLSPQIYVIDLIERNPLKLTTDAEMTHWHPVWSPDGRHIAFTSQLGSEVELSMITAGQSTRRTLSRVESPDIYLSWSPDSQQLAFESREEEDREIFVVDIDTGLRRKLTDNEVDDCCPVWAP
jgi:Tol biopolymer transport system component